MNWSQRFKEKYGEWAMVTGASSGIGLEIASQLANIGMNVIIHGRNKQKLNELQQKLSTKVEVRVLASDVSENEGTKQIIEISSEVNIGLLVVSAGYGTSGSFLKNSIEEEVDMLKVNCEALLRLTHHFSQYFSYQKKGGIILMSSMVGFQGVPFAANYAATKAYVQSLAEALAKELKPYGVDVLAAAPGPVNSGFGTRANMNMEMSMSPNQVALPILKALGKRTTVFPGFLTKLLVYSLRTVPRWAKIRIMELVMGGMTKHQNTY